MCVRPLVRKVPWRRAWQPTPVFLPRESHGQRSLAGYIVHGVAKSRTQLRQLRMHARPPLGTVPQDFQPLESESLGELIKI